MTVDDGVKMGNNKPVQLAPVHNLNNLEKLNDLKEKKIITEDEFEAAKKKILAA